MSFQYIPFSFSNIPNINCVFQLRSNYINNSSCLDYLEKNNYGDLSLHSAASQNLDGNISYVVNDIEERVENNRHAMQNTLNFTNFSEIHQVHGSDIIFDPKPCSIEKSELLRADGLATDKRDFALMVKSADCQSILFSDTKGKYIMAIHVGWRGNKDHFPRIAVEKFSEYYRLNPKEIVAVRGPSLGPYMSEFTDFEKDWTEEFRIWYNENSKCMDLWSLTKYQLISAGLRPNNIYSLDLCTSTMAHIFFSYRNNQNCGRLASLIWIS